MKDKKLDVNKFWTRFNEQAKKHNVTIGQLSAEIGTLPQNMKNKKFRKTFPTLEELVKISSYFGTTIDFLLLGKDDNPLQRRINELETRIDELESKLKSIKDLASC